MDDTEKQERLGKIAVAAVTLGFNPGAVSGSAQVARREQARSNMDVLNDLLRLFSSSAATPQMAEPDPSPDAPTASPTPAPVAPAPVKESSAESEEPPAGHFARFLKDIFNDKKEQ
ncbi:MAG: hypothetical protein H7X77_08385 [Anaerolineae bacterium]|nr:hypothetical protein [Anaerolineae bacterium]